MSYIPPFTISPKVINLVADISSQIERYTTGIDHEDKLMLRKANRIKTIHSSLAIEGNTLSEKEVAYKKRTSIKVTSGANTTP